MGMGRERAEDINRGKEPLVYLPHECQVSGLACADSGKERKDFEQGQSKNSAEL